MSIAFEIAKVLLLGFLRYASAITILLLTVTLIGESPEQGVPLAASIATWLISSWALRNIYDVSDVDDYTGGFKDER